MNVSITPEMEKFVKERVESGDFQNASEVIRDAIRKSMEVYDYKLATLRGLIQDGLDSGVSDMTVEDIMKRNRINSYAK